MTDSKFEEIKHGLTSNPKASHNLDVLFISETFCSGSTPISVYAIRGYNVYRKDRIGKSGGGLLAYSKNGLHVKRRPDLESDDVEAIWLEVFPYKSKRSLFIGSVYRPPSYKAHENQKLGKNIENVYLKNKETILLGDLNVDYLNSSDFNKHKFIKTLLSLELNNLIQKSLDLHLVNV